MSLYDGKSQVSKIFLSLLEWPGGELTTHDLYKYSGSLAPSTKISQVKAHPDFPADMELITTTKKHTDGKPIYCYRLIKKRPRKFDETGQGGLF